MDLSDQRKEQLTHQDQQQQQGSGVVASTNPMAYVNPPYQTSAPPIMATGTPSATVSSPTNFAPQQQLALHQAQHFQNNQQRQQQLQSFWANQMHEIDQTTDFKNHNLPLARIKKIIKADEDVRMISAEAPVVFAKACEMFILELTLRSWIHTEENKRRTLQKNDIAAAISRTDVFDFLVDIIPRDELKEEGLGITKAAISLVGSGSDALPYYYLHPPQAPMVGKPVDQAGLYAGQQHGASPFVPWPQFSVQHPAQQIPAEQQSSDS